MGKTPKNDNDRELTAADRKLRAEATIGRILTVQLDVLSMTAPREVIKLIRLLIIRDRTDTVAEIAKALRVLGCGALARNIEEAL